MYAIIKTGGKQYRVQQGDELRVEKLVANVGDKVVFSKYGGTDIKHEGEELTIMRQSDILAVVED